MERKYIDMMIHEADARLVIKCLDVMAESMMLSEAERKRVWALLDSMETINPQLFK